MKRQKDISCQDSTSTLILLGHPNPKSFNGEIARAYRRGATHASLMELSELKFDPILRPRSQAKEANRQLLEPDLLQAQRSIEAATHLVFVFPVWWGGLPALLKGFIDRVFLPDWAYRKGVGGMPEKLLSGRSARVIMTMDAPGWYDGFAYRHSAKRALVNATLKYCGVTPVKTTMYTQISSRTPAQRAHMLAHAQKLGLKESPRALPVQLQQSSAR